MSQNLLLYRPANLFPIISAAVPAMSLGVDVEADRVDRSIAKNDIPYARMTTAKPPRKILFAICGGVAVWERRPRLVGRHRHPAVDVVSRALIEAVVVAITLAIVVMVNAEPLFADEIRVCQYRP